MIRKFFLFTLLGSFIYGCGSSQAVLTADKTPVKTSIDLVQIENDRVKVTINPGAFSSETVYFYIPKTVPGTYSTDNYGQYIEGFKAYDYDMKELGISKTDENSWNISNGKQLDKIVYYVNDTYDSEREQKEPVFSPAGTNIQKGSNFMLNLHGFVGYFNGLQEVPYEISIQSPENLEPTTSLRMKGATDNAAVDTFLANRYFEVIDNPILYASPNAATFQINDISVTLSLFSPNGVYKASDLKESMEKMMGAQKAFLGDIDGTKEYNIILYLSTMEDTDASGFGALEHHTSTVVVLPEQMPKANLEQAMIDVVSHEFFHIVTPLNVHSEEVQYFDFNDPKMSQHLWMYEGTTEYFANLFQIQQDLIDEKEFFNRLMTKINNASSYDDSMSFTEMSQNILSEPYKANYANVYEKGALINMGLDILLRELSNGEKGVLWLMKELSKEYDVDTPFKDDQLIDLIVSLTYPEVRAYFETHVVGKTPIDYSIFLAKMGLKTTMTQEPSGFFLKGQEPYIDVDQANDNAIFIRKGIELNTFFKDLGAQGGDIIKSINGTVINLDAIRPIIGESFGWTPETKISMVIQRGDEELTLEGAVGTPLVNVKSIIPADTSNETQEKLRKAWMKG